MQPQMAAILWRLTVVHRAHHRDERPYHPRRLGQRELGRAERGRDAPQRQPDLTTPQRRVVRRLAREEGSARVVSFRLRKAATTRGIALKGLAESKASGERERGAGGTQRLRRWIDRLLADGALLRGRQVLVHQVLALEVDHVLEGRAASAHAVLRLQVREVAARRSDGGGGRGVVASQAADVGRQRAGGRAVAWTDTAQPARERQRGRARSIGGQRCLQSAGMGVSQSQKSPGLPPEMVSSSRHGEPS